MQRDELTRRDLLLGATAGAAVGLCTPALAHAGPKAGPTSGDTTKIGPAAPARGSKARPRAQPTSDPAPAVMRPKLTKSLPAITPEEKAVAEEIAQKVRHAVASAAAEPRRTKFPAGSYAAIGQTYIRGLKRKRRRAVEAEAARAFSASVEVRKKAFGMYATAAPSTHLRKLPPVRAQLASAAADKLRNVSRRFVATNVSSDKLVLRSPYANLGFHINEVRCKRETDEVGADEIIMGGFAIAPDGTMQKIDVFTVSNDFDAGEVRTYYPQSSKHFTPDDPYRGRRLATLPLASNAEWPATYTLVVFMGEEDGGGFGQFLGDIYGRVADEVKALILAQSIQLGAFLGPAIAQVVGFVMDLLVDFLSILFGNKDDYVDRMETTLTIGSPNKADFATIAEHETHVPPNVWASRQWTKKYLGDGGYYKCKFHWRVWD
jgi:hypothetical protein